VAAIETVQTSRVASQADTNRSCVVRCSGLVGLGVAWRGVTGRGIADTAGEMGGRHDLISYIV